MTQSVSNIAFVAAYHEAKKVSQYGNSQTTFQITGWELLLWSELGDLQLWVSRSQAVTGEHRACAPTQRWVSQPSKGPAHSEVRHLKNVIDDCSLRLASGNYAACGFQIFLQRKHQPLIYQVNSARKRKKGLNLKNFRSTSLAASLYLCPGSVLWLTQRLVIVIFRRREQGRQERNDGHVFLAQSLKFHNIAFELGTGAVKKATLWGEEGEGIMPASMKYAFVGLNQIGAV